VTTAHKLNMSAFQNLIGTCGSTIATSRQVNGQELSAVAEMGDRGHNRHGPKRGGLLYPFRGGSWAPSNTMWLAGRLGRGLFPYQVAS